MLKNTAGTIYVDNSLQTYSTDLRINVNKEKAALYGVQTSEIDRVVRMGVSGLNIASYKDEKGDSHPISIGLPHATHQTRDVFDKLYVASGSGKQIPLNQLTSFRYESSVPVIKRYDKNRYALVTSYVQEAYNTRNVTSEAMEKIRGIGFPAGYSFAAAGEVESSNDSFGGLGTIIIITIFGFLAVLCCWNLRHSKAHLSYYR